MSAPKVSNAIKATRYWPLAAAMFALPPALAAVLQFSRAPATLSWQHGVVLSVLVAVYMLHVFAGAWPFAGLMSSVRRCMKLFVNSKRPSLPPPIPEARGPTFDVPADVLHAIRALAQRDHPGDFSTQRYVIQTQRDLATAQNNELQAILSYRRSLVELERLPRYGELESLIPDRGFEGRNWQV